MSRRAGGIRIHAESEFELGDSGQEFFVHHARAALQRFILVAPARYAVQVDEAFQNFKKFTNLRAHVIFGGVGYGPQREAIARGLDIVVATPGRLQDLGPPRPFPASGRGEAAGQDDRGPRSWDEMVRTDASAADPARSSAQDLLSQARQDLASRRR